MKAKCLGPLQIIMWPCHGDSPREPREKCGGVGLQISPPHDDAEVQFLPPPHLLSGSCVSNVVSSISL